MIRPKPGHRSFDFACLFLLGALWGSSYLFIRIAAPVLGSVTLMATRSVIAVVVLLLCLALRGPFPDFRKHWRHFLVIGWFGTAIPFVMAGNAVIHMNASIPAILNATTPMFTALLATIWLGEPFRLRTGAGVLLGVTGVVTLVGWSPLPLTPKVLFAAAQAVLAAAYGFTAVYARRWLSGISPLQSATGQLIFSAALLVPFAAAQPPARLPGPALLAVAALGIACTALAYLLYYHLIAALGAMAGSIVTFLVPCFSLAWGVLLLGEPLTLGVVLGMGMILLSVRLVLGGGTSRSER